MRRERRRNARTSAGGACGRARAAPETRYSVSSESFCTPLARRRAVVAGAGEVIETLACVTDGPPRGPALGVCASRFAPPVIPLKDLVYRRVTDAGVVVVVTHSQPPSSRFV